jgi:uncharacterized repeat protein (TIGR01451 family)
LLTYTLVVGNSGPNAAANVVVTDVLSSGTTFVSARSNKGSLGVPPAGQTGVVTWNLGTMSQGGSEQATLTITIKVRGKITVVNEATVSADTPDLNASNNLASITTKVGAAARTR